MLGFISYPWILQEVDIHNALSFTCKSLSGFILPTIKRALRAAYLSMAESRLSILFNSLDAPEWGGV